MGLPEPKPGVVLRLPPLHPFLQPSLPFPAFSSPPSRFPSKLCPSCPSWQGWRAPSAQPAIYFSISLPVLLSPGAPSLPHTSGFHPTLPDPGPLSSAGRVKPRACQSKQQQEEGGQGQSRQRAESTSRPCLAAPGWGGSPGFVNALACFHAPWSTAGNVWWRRCLS